MTKMEFLAKIRLGLSSLTEDETQRSFEFYREMIDDRIEDGLTEEEAVAAAGDPNEIIRNILAESTPKKQVQKPQTEQNKQIPQKKSSNSGWTLLAVLLIILFVITQVYPAVLQTLLQKLCRLERPHTTVGLPAVVL